MRFVLAIGLLMVSTASANFYVDVKANKSSFLAGEKALVSVRLNTQPENEALEFFLTATLDDVTALTLKPVTKYQSYIETPALTSGVHPLKVYVFLQDKALAKELNDAIAYYQKEITTTQTALATATDPQEIVALEARLAQNQDRLAKTTAELNALRTHIDHQATINLHVL